MVRTPWGNAAELRSRRLRPGPSESREAVARNQRERLFAATVAAVAEHGYEAVRVADVVKLSGVSRSAFYRHFEDKLDCFLATIDAIAAFATDRIAAAYAVEGSWDDRLRAAADEFLALVLEQPAAAHVCLVDVYAAGAPATERLDRATAAVEREVVKAFEESPEHAGMPHDIVRGIVGGINKAIHTRLRRGEESELPRIVPELVEWGLGYHAPPKRLRRPRRMPDRGAAPVHTSGEAAERLTTAMTATVAEHGYPNATISEIADRAAASLSTFYAHFPTKEDAFQAVVDRAHTDLIAAAVPPYERAGDWRHGVRDGLDALLGFLAAEPAVASVAVIDVLAAGPAALEGGDRTLAALDAYLAAGYDEAAASPPAIASEAIAGAIYSLVYAQIRKRRVERMRELAPTAAFVALAPFLGSREACAVANAPVGAF
jgi:AcrR family transcriptional regulator